MLRQRELDKPWRLGKLYLTSLRTLLEGKREESLAVSEELMQQHSAIRKEVLSEPAIRYLRHEAQALDTLSRPSITVFSAIRPCCATRGSIRCELAPNSRRS